MTVQQAGFAILHNRGVVAVAGEDRVAFLQGLVSNDMLRVQPDQAVHSLFLTPQGKYLHDFTMAASADGTDTVLFDPEMDRRADLLRRLKIYKLRSRIVMQDRAEDLAVVALFGGDTLDRLGLPAIAGRARALAVGPSEGGASAGVVFTDARLPALGARAYLPKAGLEETLAALGFVAHDAEDYRRMRIAAGVPTGADELEPEKALPLENRFDALNSISWDKGCYMGQELTARTRYRALIKKKLFPIRLDSTAAVPGIHITNGERDLGEIKAVSGDRALAMLRLEDVQQSNADGRPLMASGGTTSMAVTVEQPDWMTSQP